MKKPRILVVGSINMDLTVLAEKLPEEGETVYGMNFSTAPGGKGANQAVQAARLGASVTMVGRTGNDEFGKILRNNLEESGVDVSHVIPTEGVTTAVANILLEKQPDGSTSNRIVIVPGANACISAEDVAFLEEGIAEYDVVILQYEIPQKVNEIVAEYAFRKNVPVMVNPAPSAPTSAELLSHATYFSPNEHEAEDLTGVTVATSADAEKAAGKLIESGVKNVIITRGSAGAFFMNKNTKIESPCIPTQNVADPTAAGDSFIGAFCFATAMGSEIGEALRFANYTAHITVSRMGAQPSLPYICEVLEEMKKDGIDCARCPGKPFTT